MFAKNPCDVIRVDLTNSRPSAIYILLKKKTTHGFNYPWKCSDVFTESLFTRQHEYDTKGTKWKYEVVVDKFINHYISAEAELGGPSGAASGGPGVGGVSPVSKTQLVV